MKRRSRTDAEHELVHAVRANVVPGGIHGGIHHAEAARADHSRRQMLRSAARRDAERLAQRMVEDDAVELAPT